MTISILGRGGSFGNAFYEEKQGDVQRSSIVQQIGQKSTDFFFEAEYRASSRAGRGHSVVRVSSFATAFRAKIARGGSR